MAPHTHTLVGTKAPSFKLTNYNGDKYAFQPGQGFPIVLYFYPKAGSYGCTRQACQLRDALESKQVNVITSVRSSFSVIAKKHFKDTKVQVVGISADPVEDQARFVEKQKLTYPVLSDSEGEAHKVYCVGKGLFGLVNARVTFLIDADGIVRDVLNTTINYSAHAKFIAKWLATFPTEEIAPKATPGQSTLTTEEELSLERVSDLPPQL